MSAERRRCALRPTFQLTTLCGRASSLVRVRTLAAVWVRRGWPRVSSLLGVSIERREFLLLGGAVATGAGLAGCTSTRRGGVSPGGSRPGSAPAAPSPAVSLPGSAQVQLGPQVVHGPRDRARAALTFHGQGPVSMADELLAEAERAGARVTVLAAGTWLEQYPQMARRILGGGHDRPRQSHAASPGHRGHRRLRRLRGDRGLCAAAARLDRVDRPLVPAVANAVRDSADRAGGPQGRLPDMAAAQPSSCSACPAQARTRSSPSSSSAALIATAVCETLCGSIPIITAVIGPASYPGRGKGTRGGTPDSRTSSLALAPLLSHTTGEAPARRHVVRKPGPARGAGRRLESQPTGTSQRYAPTHCHPGQARTVYQKSQSGGSVCAGPKPEAVAR